MGLTQTKVERETETVSAILEMFSRGLLRDNHPQQRRAGQHSTGYRDNFIATVIKQEDFDSLKICEQIKDGKSILWLIDGMQRLSEMREYRNNIFKLSSTIENPIVIYKVVSKDESGNLDSELVECDLRGKYYSDLPKELQLQFDMCPVLTVLHKDCTDKEIAYHIRRYNRQTTMNGAQTCITYAEKWAEQIKNITQNNRFFLDCGYYSANEIQRGILDRIIMESVMSVFHLDDWKKQTNRMGQYVNENATEEEFNTLDQYLTELYPITEGRFKDFFNAKNSFIFMAVYHEFKSLGLEVDKFGEFLSALETDLHSKEIDGVSFDSLNENRATKDKTVIKQKIEYLIKLMYEYLGVKKSDTYDDKSLVLQMTDLTEEELSEDWDFYNECLDDFFDRIVPFNSKYRERRNRLPLLATMIYAFKKEWDFESWLWRFVDKDTCFLGSLKENCSFMIMQLEDFFRNKQIA